MLRVFGHHVPLAGCIEFLADLLLCIAAVLLASVSLSGSAVAVHGPLTLAEALGYAGGFAGIMSLMYAFVGLYRPIPVRLPVRWLRTAFALALGGYLTYMMLRLVADRTYLEQLVWASVVYVLVLVVPGRTAVRALTRASTLRRVLIVGADAEALAVAADLHAAGRGKYHLVGLCATTDEDESRDAVAGAPVFVRGTSIEALVAEHRVDEIVVAAREQRGGSVPMDELLACRIRGLRVFDSAAYYERTRAEVPLESLKASFLIYGQGFVQGPARRAAKRAFDIVCSLLLLLVSAPVMAVTALAIKLDSRGPVLYRQERAGLGGRPFVCLKFRSMKVDAEPDGVARWAVKDDPRATRVGSFIRKMRIDELPQLFNVLRGEMSLVGPRPERPSFVADLQREIPFYALRHSVKPGVTGWAQVRYTYGASVEDARKKHQLDLYYVKNNSLFLDVLVLIETVSVVLFREGQ